MPVIPQAGANWLTGQRGPGRRTYEMQRLRRRDNANVVTALGQQPQQFACLVGSDASADSEYNAHRPGGLGQVAGISTGSACSMPSLISRSAIDSGFS